MEKLEIPRSLQTDDYSCGAHCVKMIADYHGLVHPKTGLPYSITSIKRMCKTTKEFGTEISNLVKALDKLGLKRKRVTLKTIASRGVKKPILTLIKDDEPNTDHYVLIDGYDHGQYSVIEPMYHITEYIGINQMVDEVRKYDKKHWLWEIRK